MEWEATVKRLLLADTSDLVELARIAGRDPKTFYRDANLRGAKVTVEERAALGLPSIFEAAFVDPTKGRNLRLEDRIAELEALLPSLAGEGDEAKWAAVQDRIGQFYLVLGSARHDIVLLENGQRAVQDALSVLTKDGMPIQWAKTTGLHAEIYSEIGRHTRDQGTLLLAVELFSRTLEVITPDVDPSTWAHTTSKLGYTCLEFIDPFNGTVLKKAINTFKNLRNFWLAQGNPSGAAYADFALGSARLNAGRAGDTAQFHKARYTFERRLEAGPPISRDAANVALGQTLLELGKLGDRSALEQALNVLSEAVAFLKDEEEFGDGSDWAFARFVMAQTYRALGDFGSALEAVDDALTVLTSEKDPRDYATAIALRDEVIGKLSQQTGIEPKAEPDPEAPDIFEGRIAELESELQAVTREQNPGQWASFMVRLGNLYHQAGLRETDTGPLYGAQDYFTLALEVQTRDQMPVEWAETLTKRGRTRTEIGRLTGRYDIVREGIDDFRNALKIRTRQDAPTKWADTQMLLGDSDLLLAERGRERYARLAVSAYRAALTVFDKASHRAKWMQGTYGLGLAELVQATASGKATATPARRLAALLSDYGSEMSEKRRLDTTIALGLALVLHGRLRHDLSRREGLELLEQIAPQLASAGDDFRWANVQEGIAQAYAAQGDHTLAHRVISEALTVFTPDKYPYRHERAMALRAEYEEQAEAEQDG